MSNMVLPVNSEKLTVNEMIEVNGGEKYTYYLTNDQCKAVCFAICGSLAGMTASAVIAAVDVAIITISAFIPGMAGLTSTVFAGFAWEFAKTMTEICLTDNKGLKIDYEYPLNLKFSVTTSK